MKPRSSLSRVPWGRPSPARSDPPSPGSTRPFTSDHPAKEEHGTTYAQAAECHGLSAEAVRHRARSGWRTMPSNDGHGSREACLSVSGMDEGTERLIVLWWHRNWLIPLWLPVFVRVSASLAFVVNRR
jgi:hypothetical protein